MARETSTFSDWLSDVVREAAVSDLVTALAAAARKAEDAFGARFWFAEIMGRRWSYVAGDRAETPALCEFERIPLGPRMGLVAADWGTLDEDERATLVGFFTDLVRARQSR